MSAVWNLRVLTYDIVLVGFYLSLRPTFKQLSLNLNVSYFYIQLPHRAQSTHPASEPLFELVLKAYQERMGREWVAISRRLDDGQL